MTIRRIHIDAFGPLRDLDFKLYSGMNYIRGENESGKSSLAMFIKFIFYGLSGKSSDGAPSERKKYVNWDTGRACGYIEAENGGKELRIERSLTVSARAGGERESIHETVSVTDAGTGGRIPDFEECPGAAILGVPEQVFVNTVFAGQSGRGAVNGADTAAAVENMLFSADETVSVKKAADRLDKYRRSLLHKKGSGGEIAALRETYSSLKQRFDEAGASAEKIIELENRLSLCERSESDTDRIIESRKHLLRIRDAREIVHEGRDAAAASEIAKRFESEYRSALSLCCEPEKLDEGKRLCTSIVSERAGISEFEKRLAELEAGASSDQSDIAESPETLTGEYDAMESAAKKLSAVAAVFSVISFLTAIGAAALFAAKNQIGFLCLLGVFSVCFVISGILLILLGGKRRGMRSVLDKVGVGDRKELGAEVDFMLSQKKESEELLRRAESVRLSLNEAYRRMEALETEAEAIAASFESCAAPENDRDASDGDPLERLKRAVELAGSRQSEADELRTKYAAASAAAEAKWSRISRDKLTAAENFLRSNPDTDGVPDTEAETDAMRTELSFNQAKLEAMMKKRHSIEVELAEKRSNAEDPARLWEELCRCREKLDLLISRHDASELALETLAQAGENMRRGIIPRIIRRASEYFSNATGGRYESLGAGSAFELSAVSNGHTRETSLLSSGTEDLAYVCLRVALAAELFGGNRPPLIFDESFAFMDFERSGAAADVLASSGHQVLYFTCRPEDAPDPALTLIRK